MATAEIDVQHIDQLWSRFKQRLAEDPGLRIEQFAAEHSEHADDIRRVFPLMRELEAIVEESPGQLSAIDELPQQIGRYPILRQIGVGGMGVVYEAECNALRERVAIKVISSEKLSVKNIERFRKEARSVAVLHHTNIVPIYEFGHDEDSQFYTMRLVDGPNLSDVIYVANELAELEDTEELDPQDAQAIELLDRVRNNWSLIANLGSQAAAALSHAHSKDMLHRDIKPANLLVDATNKLWVTDFGLAKSTLDDNSLTSMYQAVGTPRYMAPEQIRGECDYRSDLFSLGLTLYELVTLEKVDAERREALLRGGAGTIRSVNPQVPAELERILLKTCNAHANLRYQSAGELIDDLDAFSQDNARRTQHRNRNRFLAGIGTIATLAILCVLLIAPLRNVIRQAVGMSSMLPSTPASDTWSVSEGAKTICVLPDKFGDTRQMELSGVDAEHLLVNHETRELQFTESPNFEVPLDENMDNLYQVCLISAEGSKSWPLDIRVANVNEPPRFDEFAFEDDGVTVIRSDHELNQAWMVDVSDDTNTLFDGLCVSLAGGKDQDRLLLTPQGVFVFDQTGLPNEGGRFEFEVQVSDESQPWTMRLEQLAGGSIALIKERIVAGATLESIVVSKDCLMRRDVIDFATCDGETFYHIHRDNKGTAALFRSKLTAEGTFDSQLVNADCGLPQESTGFATCDGVTFYHVVRRRGGRQTLEVFESKLQQDGMFTSVLLSDDSGLPAKTEGFSMLDAGRFHHIRRHTTGDSSLYFSWLRDGSFTNMQLHDSEHQFTGTSRGQAAWVAKSNDSKTTTQKIVLQRRVGQR